MSASRVALIQQAFGIMDRTHDGIITLEDLQK
jgi:hypothetical protein